jgi:hypothetical protein
LLEVVLKIAVSPLPGATSPDQFSGFEQRLSDPPPSHTKFAPDTLLAFMRKKAQSVKNMGRRIPILFFFPFPNPLTILDRV